MTSKTAIAATTGLTFGLVGAAALERGRLSDQPYEVGDLSSLEELQEHPLYPNVIEALNTEWSEKGSAGFDQELADARKDFDGMDVLDQGDPDSELVFVIFNGTFQGLDERSFAYGKIAEEVFGLSGIVDEEGRSPRIITIPGPSRGNQVGLSLADGARTMRSGQPNLYARSVADKVISNTEPSQVMTFGYSVGAVLSQSFASEIAESGIDVRLAIGAAPSGIISQGVDQVVAALARSSGDFGERLRTSGIDALAHYYWCGDTSITVALRGIMITIGDMISQPLSNLGLWRVDARDIYRRIVEQNLQRVGRVVTAFALQDQVTSPGAHAEIARFFSDNDNFDGFWTEGQHDALASPANFTSLLLHTLEKIKQTS